MRTHDRTPAPAVRNSPLRGLALTSAVACTLLLGACGTGTSDSEDPSPASPESTEAVETEETAVGEEDLEAAEETTNAAGDTVYVIPQTETAKIFHWQHLYGITLTVDEASETDRDGAQQAVVGVTLANDGLHSEHYQGEGHVSASSALQEFGLYTDLERESEPVAEDGGSTAFEGEWLVNRDDVTLDPGDSVSGFELVFPLDHPSEDGTYYLTYRGYSDVLYAWEVEVG